MKKQFYILLFGLFLTFNLCAQAPQAFYFQAFAFDNTGMPLSEQTVGLEVVLLAGGPDGAVVYTETHNLTTEINGAIQLMIGQGTSSENLESIDWGNNIHFLQLSIDLDGGTDYQLLGVTQILSVPYALFAQNLVGEQGSQGQQGQQGNPGPQGPSGPQNDTGATGATGPTGEQGLDGLATNGIKCWDDNGNDVMDVAEDDNNDGVFDQDDCPQGQQGPTGPIGPSSPDGSTGATGPQGPSGDIIWETDNANNPTVINYNIGSVGIGTNTPSCLLDVAGTICANGMPLSSDRRYKTNIRTIKGGLDSVLKMRGVTYDFNQEAFPQKQFSTEKQIGLIAQEVETIFPELVATDSEGYKAVNYVQLTPILLEAIKELAQQKADLTAYKKAKLALLETQLNDLMIQMESTTTGEE